MADTPTSQLPSLRTYARDLESERQRRGLPSVPTPAGKTAPSSPPPVPQPQAPVANPPKPTAPPPQPSPAPEHIVVATPRPERVSKAVLATREDELKKERENRPATIPPFHTLKSAARAAGSDVVRETEIITIDNDESAATVITDTKRGRFNLRRSLFSLLGEWWQKRAKERKARKTPKYVVPETDRRKGVIQRATSHTGRQVTGDRAQLHALVRERESKPTPDEAETIWTPNTETIFELLPAPEGASHFSNVTTTPRRSGSSTEVPRREVPPPSLPPVAVVPAPAVITPPAPTTAEPAPPVTTPEPLTIQEPEPVEPTVPAPRPRSLPRPATKRRFDTNTLAIGIVAIVVVLALGGIALRSYFTPDTGTVIAESPLPLDLPLRTISLTDGTRDAIINNLTAAQADATLPLQLLQFENGGVAIAPGVLLTLLGNTMSTALTGEVDALYFGWHERTTPFVVLSVVDRTRVWGSLLASERELGSVFSPLLRTTDDQVFTDTQAGSFDLRSYRTAEGNEALVYGFVNENTLIITKDQATFLLLSALATKAP